MPDPPDAPFRIEIADASIQQKGRSRRIAWLGVAMFMVAIPLFALAAGVSAGPVRDTLRQVANGGMLLSPLLLVVAFLARLPSRRRGVPIAVEGDHLSIGRRAWIPLSELTEGSFHPASQHVELRRKNGDIFRIRPREAEDGERLLEAVGLDASKRTLRMTLGETTFLDLMSLLVGAPTACGVASALARALSLGPPAAIVLGLVAALLSFWGVREMFGPAMVTVGADGVVIRRWMRDRFYPHDRIANLVTDDEHVELCLTDGSQVWAKARHLSVDEQAALHARFENARRAFREGAVSQAALAELDRGRRSVSAWREALGSVLTSTDVYRRRALTREDLLAVLASPSAPVDRRIGAAVALSRAGEAEDRARIRVAAAACADTKVRVALEKAADEALDDEALVEALEGEGRPVARRVEEA